MNLGRPLVVGQSSNVYVTMLRDRTLYSMCVNVSEQVELPSNRDRKPNPN